MDAFLSGEASQSLEAISLAFRGLPVFGVLIGHKRDHRIIVEKALPAPGRSPMTSELFFELDELFEGRIVGFFGQRASRGVVKSILCPFGFGKLYLEIRPGARKGAGRRSFVVDHEKVFCLRPVPLRTDKKEGKT